MSSLTEKLQQVRSFVRRLLTQPTSELSRCQQTARYLSDLVIHCTRALRHDRATQMAAALTYHTLFSLMPMLVLVLVFLAGFRGLEGYAEQFKTTVIDTLLPETLVRAEAPEPQLSIDPPLAPPVDGAAPDEATPLDPATAAKPDDPIAAAVSEASKQDEFNRARVEMRSRIQSTLNELGNVSFGSIGVVGLLVFIYGATALLTTIERSFSMIFGVDEVRSIRVRLPIHFTVITLGPVLIIAGQVLQRKFIDLIQAEALTGWLAKPMVVLSPLLTSWLVLYVIFSLMPNTRVQRRAAAIGSFVAAALWLVSKEGFAAYVLSAKTLGIYGALGLIPLFLLWVFITWLIVLFGLELTYTIQNMKGRRFKHIKDKSPEQVLVDSTWMIPVAARVADDFAAGRTTSADAAAAALNLPAHAVRKLLRALTAAGLVRRVATSEQDADAYTLARPAESIDLGAVLAAADSIMPTAPAGANRANNAAWAVSTALGRSIHATARQTTLAELVAARTREAE